MELSNLEWFLSERQQLIDEYNRGIYELVSEYARCSGFENGVLIRHKGKPYTSIIEKVYVGTNIGPIPNSTEIIHKGYVDAISTNENWFGNKYHYTYLIENIELVDEEYIVPKYVKKPEPPKPPKTTWIYLMKDEANGYYKIGHSKNAEARERTLQSEKPTIVMLYKTHGNVNIEKELHKIYDEKRIRGEWFSLTEDEVKGFPELVETIKSKKPE
jgi:hypothetical protein